MRVRVRVRVRACVALNMRCVVRRPTGDENPLSPSCAVCRKLCVSRHHPQLRGHQSPAAASQPVTAPRPSYPPHGTSPSLLEGASDRVRVALGTPPISSDPKPRVRLPRGRYTGAMQSAGRQGPRSLLRLLRLLDMGCNWFLLSCGCDGSRYRVAHGTRLTPNGTPFPCRTQVACVVPLP